MWIRATVKLVALLTQRRMNHLVVYTDFIKLWHRFSCRLAIEAVK